jgi:hypothetical protein
MVPEKQTTPHIHMEKYTGPEIQKFNDRHAGMHACKCTPEGHAHKERHV